MFLLPNTCTYSNPRKLVNFIFKFPCIKAILYKEPTWCNFGSIKMGKTNSCTEFQLYWYDDCTCFGQPFCPSSGVLSRISVLVHYMQLWWPYATRSRMALPGSLRLPQLHITYQNRFMSQNCRWWGERLTETCRVVIPIKLEFILICYDARSCEKNILGQYCLLINVRTLYSFRMFTASIIRST
jgi:hypothetical protein